MSNVTLTLGGRYFTVACAEGEEDHVAGLGRMIAAKIAAMGDLSGQSETRMLLFAALLLADELHEATVRTPASGAPRARPRSGFLPAYRLPSTSAGWKRLGVACQSVAARGVPDMGAASAGRCTPKPSCEMS